MLPATPLKKHPVMKNTLELSIILLYENARNSAVRISRTMTPATSFEVLRFRNFEKYTTKIKGAILPSSMAKSLAAKILRPSGEIFSFTNTLHSVKIPVTKSQLEVPIRKNDII